MPATKPPTCAHHATPPVIREMKWLQSGGVNFNVGTMVDGLSTVMLVVVTLISLLVHVFSTDYVAGDRRYTHYFAFLSLFTASMLFFVLSQSGVGGMRVQCSGPAPDLAIGQSVSLFGALGTVHGQRVLLCETFKAADTVSAVRPLGMQNKAIGGAGANALTPGVDEDLKMVKELEAAIGDLAVQLDNLSAEDLEATLKDGSLIYGDF